MARFRYRGRNSMGDPVEGTMDAGSIDNVAENLAATGVVPIDIKPTAEISKKVIDLSGIFKPAAPSLTDLIMFSRQMYTLVKAGVPLSRAVKGLGESSRNELLSAALLDVNEKLETGRTLSQSLAQQENVFPPLFISIVQVGEDSGNLEEAFLQLSKHLELEHTTRQRIKSALRYPMMVIIAIVSAVVLINIFVIPQFADIFAQFNTDLPWATQVLLASSNFMVNSWPFLLAIVLGLIGAFRYWISTEGGRLLWDEKKLRIPIAGSIVERAVLGRFARTFALVLRSGVPFMQGLVLVARAVGNEYVAKKLLEMGQGVERGEALARTAQSSGLFTPLVMQMVTVGEETGQVDSLLQEVADYYEREVDEDVKSLSSSIEPILIVAIGGIVLILALGVFLPMWDLSSTVQGGG